MFKESYDAMINAAQAKAEFLKRNPTGYLMLSVLAGAYVGLGNLLACSIGARLSGLPYAKLITACSFGIALSLVIMAGAELFTGNNTVMVGGLLSGKVSLKRVCVLWLVCFLGNWLGAIFLSVAFRFTGLCDVSLAEFMLSQAAEKTSLSPLALFFRGVLCNFAVCLAVWCSYKSISESAKLIMVFWCLFAFVTLGFEHSVANMTLFTTVILNKGLSLGLCLYNMFFVTAGNVVGGAVCVAAPYYIAAYKYK